MKKITSLICLVLLSFTSKSQQQDWNTNPMPINSSNNAKLGSNNFRSLNLVTNDTTRMRVDSLGLINIRQLEGSGMRLVFADAQGVLRTIGGGGSGNGDEPELNPHPCFGGVQSTNSDASVCMSKPCVLNTLPWYEGGNDIGPAGRNTIGTCSEHDFVMKTHNVNHVWLKTDGKMGIGTASPGAKLEVADDAEHLSVLRLRNEHWASGQTTALEFWNGSQTNRGNAASRIVSRMEGFSGGGEALDFETETNGDNFSSVKMTLTNDGKLLIGDRISAANSSPLTVNANGGNGFEVFDHSMQRINFKVEASGKTIIGLSTNATNSSPLCVNANGGNGFEVYDHSSQRINFKVKANGVVYAREVEVTNVTPFPDYVFDKNYQLTPIKKVAEFIKQNKHLPGFEKGEHYEKNGMNINQIILKQQEKIEELMLYVIELEKRMEAVEKNKTK